ncbi:hypothetical protein HaLaN_27243 [Haematococcus lacustris]|uniref:Uncharacterized protein n=1 Tax=Haematococcus lacustris TaxID=44745 RepID=A0A6A0A819_HAELA|nr:hypothetical protein HaLaN_27243 [Haematococcus lacustris]
MSVGQSSLPMGEVLNCPTALLDKHERLAAHTTACWAPLHALTRNLDCPKVVRGGRVLPSKRSPTPA